MEARETNKNKRNNRKNKTKLTLIHSGFTNADRLQYDRNHNKG